MGNNQYSTGSTDAATFNRPLIPPETALLACPPTQPFPLRLRSPQATLGYHDLDKNNTIWSGTSRRPRPAILRTWQAAQTHPECLRIRISIPVPPLACGTIGSGVHDVSPWQYDTGGEVQNSIAILSADGTQLAFVQSYNTSNTTTAAELVLLTPGTSSTLAIPTLETAANYPNCTAPCMTLFPLTNDDTNSSPFVDYTNNNLYIGDDAGQLHAFSGVFNEKTPEVSWSVAVSGNKLTSPVFDGAHVFIADSGGFLYSYNTSGTLVGNSSQLAKSGRWALLTVRSWMRLLIPSTFSWVTMVIRIRAMHVPQHRLQRRIPIFHVSFITKTNTGTVRGAATTTTWATGTNCGVESVFGVGNTSTVIYDGTFDNAYMTAGGSPTVGNLWTCGATGTSAPKLNASSMSSSGFASSNIQTAATNIVNPLGTTATCSPATEIYNSSGPDYIYFSVTTGGAQSGCTGACVYSYTLTSGTAYPPTASISHGLPASGGASGIVIDNALGGGGSQIYFTYLSQATSTITCPVPSNGASAATSGGCAVQASQSGLQ